MTDHLQLKLLPDDSAYNWGALQPNAGARRAQRGSAHVDTSVRSVKQSLSTTLPKYEDTRRFKFSAVFVV